MKYITDRKEIVKAMDTHQCITINMRRPVSGFETIFEGEKVGVKCPSKRFGEITVYGTIHYYKEENKFYVQHVGDCIKASFGAEDIKEIKERKYCPKVSEGEEVLLIQDCGEYGVIVRVMKVTRCNSMCTDACVLVDVE